MGWRGMLRSMAAAERRQKKATQRQLNQLDRVSSQVDRAVDDINAECERDLGKVAEVERRMQDHPLSEGELTYDRGSCAWKFKIVADRTGVAPEKVPSSVGTVRGSIFQRNGLLEIGKTIEKCGHPRGAPWTARALIRSRTPG